MAHRRLLGCLAALALVGCKDDGKGKGGAPGSADLDARCSQLAKACSSEDKHMEKLFDGCKALGQKQSDAACTSKLVALYDCYEKQVCGGADKVWAFDDLRVLASRHTKCADEAKAFDTCTAVKK